MKEQVARILGNMAHEIEQCDCKDPAYGLEIKQATLQICQLFEPELEPMEKLAIELKDCMYQGEPKPDEGRLLTDWILGRYGIRLVGGKAETFVVTLKDLVAEQDAKTASIKDAEFAKEYHKWEKATMKAQQVIIEHYRAECQERVEGIFKEIEKVYGKTFGRKQQFIGVIPSEDWQAIKKKELK